MTQVSKKPCSGFAAAWLLFLSIYILFPPLSFADDGPYVDGLIREASSRRLFERQEWRALVHYRPTLARGFHSVIDDPVFFLSDAGKEDPQKEMEATIRAFFMTGEKNGLHPRCRFVARFSWLKKELNIDESLLPPADCSGFKEYIGAIKPESSVLIFPVAHMNSPASMFGHTLLRIDSGTESKLLSYAVNYSAFTDETNGIAFAFKGIFGYYKGYFTILPYYEKIKEYSDIEKRDMWEYRLNFTKEEVRRIVEHIWELKDIYSYYYFFDENCSYNLMLVLEAGRPGLDLAGAVPPWVIPMDTITAVEGAGLGSGEPFYRPSRATRIGYIESVTAPYHQTLAKEIAEGYRDPEEALNGPGMDRAEEIKTLDLAVEYIQYLYSKKKLEREEYLKRYIKILSARSTLGKSGGYDIPRPASPDTGHGPSRVFAGAGVKRGASYLSLGIRPANHALMDPDAGYLQGAAISFLDTEFRYNLTERKLSLERLTVLEITSISEVGRFFKPVSWKASAGVFREEFSKREHRTVFRVNGGPGISFNRGGLFYLFAEPALKVGGGLEDGYSLGGVLTAGFLKQVTGSWKTQAQARAEDYWLGDRHTVFAIEANQIFSVNANNALNLNFKRERFDGFYSSEINFAWNRYF